MKYSLSISAAFIAAFIATSVFVSKSRADIPPPAGTLIQADVTGVSAKILADSLDGTEINLEPADYVQTACGPITKGVTLVKKLESSTTTVTC